MIHLPTFNPDLKPPILLSAMQACGALYVKSQSAINFVASTLASARDEVVAAFVRILHNYLIIVAEGIRSRQNVLPLIMNRSNLCLPFAFSRLSDFFTRHEKSVSSPICTTPCLSWYAHS